MTKKIFIIIGVILLALGIAFFIFRNDIIGHAFKISISKKTKQAVTFNIGSINYSVFNSSVSFNNSNFSFSNTYLNKDKTIELSEIKFDEIKLEGLSLFHLIFKDELVAKKFLLSEPLLGFRENQNPISFTKKPKEIIGSIKEKHDFLGDLTIIVDEIEITHGKVDILSILLGEEHDGNVEFSLLLKKFNTSNNTRHEDRVLFAKNHFVKLSNFNYTLPNGDKIGFDSIVLESKTNTLVVSNIKAEIVSKSIHANIDSVFADIGEIYVNGIDFEALEKNIHDIVIDSITISDVFLQLTNKDEPEPSKISADTSNRNNDFLGAINKLNLGSLLLRNINLLASDPVGDTIVNLKNLNFGVNQIKLDSSSMIDKVSLADYSSIVVSTGKTRIFEKKSNLRISFEYFIFDERSGNISLIGIQANEPQRISARVDSINIVGVSIEALARKQPMYIGLSASNPVVDLRISEKPKSKKRAIDLNNITLSNINISNGEIHFFEKEKLDIKVEGIDLNSGHIQLDDLSKFHEINTSKLSANTSSIKILMPEKSMSASIGSLSIMDSKIKLNNISGNIYNKSKINSTISVNQLQFGGVNMAKIITDKELDIDYIKILSPKVDGQINLVSDDNGGLQKSAGNKLDLKLNINKVDLSEGIVDLNLKLENQNIEFKSGIDLLVENIIFSDIKNTAWLNKLLWKVNLSNPEVKFQDYLFSCSKIVSDRKAESLSFKSIKVNTTNNISRGLEIRKAGIHNINITGIKYNTIFNKGTPVIASISIEKPYADISIDNRLQKTTAKTGNKQKSITIPIDLDEFVIVDLSLNAEHRDSSSIAEIKLNDLDMRFHKSGSDNIFDWLDYLQITDFIYSDAVKDYYLSMQQLNIDGKKQNIRFKNIKGGNIDSVSAGKNRMEYTSSGLDIKGVDISRTIPHDIMIQEVNIEDFDLYTEDHKAAKSNSAKSDIKQIKLPDIINRFEIGIFNGGNININHVAVADSSRKETMLSNVSFLINSIKFDSTIVSNRDFQFAEQFSINISENKFISSDSLYETSFNTINYNFSENLFWIDSLTMRPRYASEDFFRKAVYQTGKIDLVINRVACHDFRLKKMINSGNIHFGGVDLTGLAVDIYRNKKYDMNPDAYVKMPQEAILGMDRIITIDSLRTHSAYIKYREMEKTAVKTGSIFLNDFNLSIYNINNDLKVLKPSSSMVAKVNAKLLGEAELNLKVTMPILSSANDFWVTGHLDKLDLSRLNPLTQNLVGITMAGGYGELDIPLLSGNSEHSEGTIIFKYQDLKVELFNRDKAKNSTGLGGIMAGFLLNDIFIRSNNPSHNKTKIGEVYFNRDTQKSFVFYIWKSIFSGLMSTMGYNNKEQRLEKRNLKR